MPESPQRLQAVPILLLGSSLRACYAAKFFFENPTDSFFGRGFELVAISNSILAGRGFASPFGGHTGPTAFLAPGYPLLVALCFRGFGVMSRASEAVLLALQVGFCVLTIYVVMLLAARVVSVRTANLAGFLLALLPFPVAIPTEFWDTALSALLLAGGALFSIELSSSRRAWAMSGAYSGLAALVNPSLLPSLVAMLGLRAWQTRRWSRLALAALVCGIVVLPWEARDLIVMHAVVPLRTNAGMELWTGNHPGADGRFYPSSNPIYNDSEMRAYKEMGEIAYMQHRTDQAKEYIASHRLEFARLTARRIGDFWSWPFLGLVVAGILLMRLAGYSPGILVAPLLLFPVPFYLTHADLRFFLVLQPIAYIPCALIADIVLVLLLGERHSKKELTRKLRMQFTGVPRNAEH